MSCQTNGWPRYWEILPNVGNNRSPDEAQNRVEEGEGDKDGREARLVEVLASSAATIARMFARR